MTVLAVLLTLTATSLPDGMTCEQVQKQYASWSWVGHRIIRQYLTIRGYTRSQIRAAERCIK